jgi:hypothetical protein
VYPAPAINPQAQQQLRQRSASLAAPQPHTPRRHPRWLLTTAAAAPPAGSQQQQQQQQPQQVTVIVPAQLQQTPAPQAGAAASAQDAHPEAWAACVQHVTSLGFTEAEAGQFVQRAFGWGPRARAYWRHEKARARAGVLAAVWALHACSRSPLASGPPHAHTRTRTHTHTHTHTHIHLHRARRPQTCSRCRPCWPFCRASWAWTPRASRRQSRPSQRCWGALWTASWRATCRSCRASGGCRCGAGGVVSLGCGVYASGWRRRPQGAWPTHAATCVCVCARVCPHAG